MKKSEMEEMLARSGQPRERRKAAAAQPAADPAPTQHFDDESIELGQLLDPRGRSSPGLQEQDRRRIGAWEERNFTKIANMSAELTTEESLGGMKIDEHTTYIAQPRAQMITCGILAVLLLGGQFWVGMQNVPHGTALYGALPWIRVAMILAGALCAFLAWPRQTINAIEESEMQERRRAQEDFRRKMRR